MGKKLEWVKEHKKEVLIASVTAVGATVSIVLGVKCFGYKKKYFSLSDACDAARADMAEVTGGAEYVIDDIFTSLPWAITSAVFDKGLEKRVLERAYDLGDNLSKHVTVSIENVYGD